MKEPHECTRDTRESSHIHTKMQPTQQVAVSVHTHPQRRLHDAHTPACPASLHGYMGMPVCTCDVNGDVRGWWRICGWGLGDTAALFCVWECDVEMEGQGKWICEYIMRRT